MKGAAEVLRAAGERPRLLSLFAGIGGFDLGLERAGFETVAFCEINPFCRAVLKQHWPDVPCFDDVRQLHGADVGPVDAICGGFPCQDISRVGRMSGLDGAKSGLWVEFHRLIVELAPRWVVIENSPMLRSKGLDRILGQLAALGYDTEWHCIPLNAIGAPHRRDRVWVVAYPTGERDGLPAIQVPAGRDQLEHSTWWRAEPAICRVADGVPGQVDSHRALGNAVAPQVAELIGRALLSVERATQCPVCDQTGGHAWNCSLCASGEAADLYEATHSAASLGEGRDG